MKKNKPNILSRLLLNFVLGGGLFILLGLQMNSCNESTIQDPGEEPKDTIPEVPIIDTTPGAEIYLDEITGPVTYRGSGFLWSISYDEPHDSLLLPMKIQLFRSRITPWQPNTGLATIMRLAEDGVPRFQVVLSDEYNLRFPYKPPPPDAPSWAFFYSITSWPGDNGDYSLWEDVITDAFDLFKSKGIEVEWDFWEEPNWYGWWEPSDSQYFETYAFGVRKLKSLDPEAVIVGPSISGFDLDYLKEFLLFAKEQDVLPDVLSWHEIHNNESPTEIPENVETIKEFMHENGIDIRKFDFNEVVAPNWQTNPGMHVWYLANMEEAGVSGACKATWREPEGNNPYNATVPTLGGYLTYPDQKPRPTWWVMKAYGDMSGDLAGVKPDDSMEGIAGIDDEKQEVRILIGRGGSHQVSDNDVLKIRNLDRVSWLSGLDSVYVVADHYPYLGWDPLPSPARIIDGNVEVQQNVVRLSFPETKHYDAVEIVLKPTLN